MSDDTVSQDTTQAVENVSNTITPPSLNSSNSTGDWVWVPSSRTINRMRKLDPNRCVKKFSSRSSQVISSRPKQHRSTDPHTVLLTSCARPLRKWFPKAKKRREDLYKKVLKKNFREKKYGRPLRTGKELDIEGVES